MYAYILYLFRRIIMNKDLRIANADDHLPLKPVVFLVLLALAEEERHGYAVMLAVRERSLGRIRLETGPLYRHLKRLIDTGVVEEVDGRPAAEDDQRRRCYYRLTELGRAVVTAEGARLATLVEATRAVGLFEGEIA